MTRTKLLTPNKPKYGFKLTQLKRNALTPAA